MKLLKFAVIGYICLGLTSCLEITETVEIKEDGSGVFTNTTDMSQMIDMLAAVGGEEFEKMKEKTVDSTFSMRDRIDSAKNLTAEEKALLADGKVNFKMDAKEKIFNIQMQYPFRNLASLEKLLVAVNKNSAGPSSIMNNVMADDDADKDTDAEDSGMEEMMKVFEYTITKDKVKRTINKDVLKKLKDDPKNQQLNEAAGMGIEINYTMVYKFPKPIKKVDNPKATVSDDRKTVKLSANLMDLFDNPERFEWTIDW